MDLTRGTNPDQRKEAISAKTIQRGSDIEIGKKYILYSIDNQQIKTVLLFVNIDYQNRIIN